MFHGKRLCFNKGGGGKILQNIGRATLFLEYFLVEKHTSRLALQCPGCQEVCVSCKVGRNHSTILLFSKLNEMLAGCPAVAHILYFQPLPPVQQKQAIYLEE